MDIRIEIKVDTRGADQLIAGLAAADTGGNVPQPIKDMYTVWGRRIEAFTRKRFEQFSRGGGDWPPLAQSTINRRRKAGTGTPFGALPGRGGSPAPGARTSLARDTKRGGQIVNSGRTVAILRDTGVLFKALTIGAQGNAFETIPSGVRYGVTGSQPHSAAGRLAFAAGSTRGRSRISIGQLASIHQTGNAKLPKREIIVAPDQRTLESMAGDATRAVARLIESR